MQLNWEIWLDHNFSPIIAKWLNEETGLNIKSSYVLDLSKATDDEIYERAKKEGNIILLSKDSDFAEIISRKGSPPKLINIKIGNTRNVQLFEFLKRNLPKAVQIITAFNIDIYELE
jgi:predicted nuclease of predicted toxin-antitoxin system